MNRYVFTKAERRIVLLFSVLFVLTLTIFKYFEPAERKLSPERIRELEQIFSSTEPNLRWQDQPIYINEIDEDSLQSLGFSLSLARQIVKYREAIGGYRSMRDFKRLYNLPDSISNKVRLKFSRTDGEKSKAKPDSGFKVDKTALPLSINEVSALELIENYGFDRKLAKRLVKYRDAIGGFNNKEQLLRVYGLKEDRLLNFDIRYASDTAKRTIPSYKNADSDTGQRVPSIKDTVFVNRVTISDLVSLGFDSLMATRMYKFGKKIGGYKSLADLKRVYGLKKEALDHYVWRYDSLSVQVESMVKESNPIDINRATKEDLMTIRGIGPVFSQRIINYRDRLGGFYRVLQIKTTPGLHSEAFKALEGKVYIGSPVKKIDVLKGTVTQLQEHPYLTKLQSKLIVGMRERSIALTEAQLKKEGVFSDREWERIAPYWLDQ